jgi:hypothetical protein
MSFFIIDLIADGSGNHNSEVILEGLNWLIWRGSIIPIGRCAPLGVIP